MSKRAKFAFISWIGKNVSALKKAKVSTDKGFVKQICHVSQILVKFWLQVHDTTDILNLEMSYFKNSSSSS